jgi:hypothetical protein
LNPEGEITVRLACTDNRVARVSVASSRTGLPPRLVRGRPADDVQRLVPLLFSICQRAQAAAAATAIAAARGEPVDERAANEQARDVTLESVQEIVWRLLIDWPKAMGETAIVGPVASVRHAASGVVDDGATLDTLLAVVDAVVAEHVYGMPADEWLGATDLAALDVWIAAGKTLPARLLRRLGEESPGLGASTVALMPEATLENLNRALLVDLEMDANYARAPRWAGRPAETGALARQAAVLLIGALLARDGRTTATRFVARLVELATLLTQLRQRASGRLPPVRSHALGGGVGIGVAETARGLLLHRVRVEDGRVADYCIVAPTEWNFHPDGPLPQGLLDRSAADPRRLEREARTIVQSLDPCVACRVEPADA